MRLLTSFIGFVLAIVVTIFIFAPERLPVGYGFEPVPVELVVQNSLAGELVQKITGNSSKNLVLKNISTSPINNLTVTLRDGMQNIKHQYIAPVMPAANEVTLGWVKNWSIESGDELEVMASSYYKVVWAL
ncbi:MAG: hypothetical protein HOM14_14650 [Gammaproteobacteria bacterium]|jgi:hypothetical protein|nr:hypothetical protein [Gammaproteobacteria bacterium]MBT3725504.1 hypothetical protein [Gammaproteobacteria bacterium]MBT4077548.1 hypothetical protein [Gammaproteobacteria bacterium]MBT4194663.1 hypothetical protein [Gammaproteobacteria bacterium]MBT4449594.1 hypothetical protein [Gammaproteobacteria bacterium]